MKKKALQNPKYFNKKLHLVYFLAVYLMNIFFMQV